MQFSPSKANSQRGKPNEALVRLARVVQFLAPVKSCATSEHERGRPRGGAARRYQNSGHYTWLPNEKFV